GPGLPANVQQAVMAFDRQHHANRNIPDLSYGPVLIGAEKQGSDYIVQVGSMPTTIAGPRPGAKPTDIATYVYANGKVTEQKPIHGGGGIADAFACETAMATRDNEAALRAGYDAMKGLMGPSLGFPHPSDNAKPEDVTRFKGF